MIEFDNSAFGDLNMDIENLLEGVKEIKLDVEINTDKGLIQIMEYGLGICYTSLLELKRRNIWKKANYVYSY
ncbi:hypothetical protein CGZ75_20135 [Paenibacillus herberti]|uniref:Uncharacterized protein n=1 Tax=Paenibacillus herberti TaxID=1619309 RepID=A0A229NU88_9BACL|nr:hypothetical protein CGZ75_20135 [Paenibacillus herberti]